jgi:hypothetical protein
MLEPITSTEAAPRIARAKSLAISGTSGRYRLDRRALAYAGSSWTVTWSGKTPALARRLAIATPEPCRTTQNPRALRSRAIARTSSARAFASMV